MSRVHLLTTLSSLLLAIPVWTLSLRARMEPALRSVAKRCVFAFCILGLFVGAVMIWSNHPGEIPLGFAIGSSALDRWLKAEAAKPF